MTGSTGVGRGGGPVRWWLILGIGAVAWTAVIGAEARWQSVAGAAVSTGSAGASPAASQEPSTSGTSPVASREIAAETIPAVPPERRVASPPGRSATQVGGVWSDDGSYVGGRWIEVRYGRPILRGRDVFGPPDFAVRLNDGAPLWRAGANQSTQLITEAALIVGGVRIEPGAYTLFVRLTRDQWTLVVSTWPAQERYDQHDRDALFGAFHYRPNKDVVRVEMVLEELPYSHDQLSWQFLDVGFDGGRLALFWDDRMAWVPFQLASEE